MQLNRALLITVIVMVITTALLCILQLWTEIIPWEFFIKTLITLGILAVLAGLIMVIKADLSSNKKLKDDNYLD